MVASDFDTSCITFASGLIIQDETDPKHIVSILKHTLVERAPPAMNWPSHNPDLNITEAVWV